MKCVICDKKIGVVELRTYVRLTKGITQGLRQFRKVYACGNCQASFDRLIDALPVDKSGCPLDVSRSELEALKLGTDRKRLEKRLRAARSIMELQTRRDFGHGRFDFDGRRLIGDSGMILQWQTRHKPDEPVAYRNQQTTVGIVSYNQAAAGVGSNG